MQITCVRTDRGLLTADQYVLALGSFSPLLLRPLGIDIPVYPVKGYSITVPITDARLAPESTIMDETHVVGALFPKGGDTTRAEFWTGLRPMTPDGTPILGATRYPKLTLATGHGTLGWTMAAGTGQIIADLL